MCSYIFFSKLVGMNGLQNVTVLSSSCRLLKDSSVTTFQSLVNELEFETNTVICQCEWFWIWNPVIPPWNLCAILRLLLFCAVVFYEYLFGFFVLFTWCGWWWVGCMCMCVCVCACCMHWNWEWGGGGVRRGSVSHVCYMLFFQSQCWPNVTKVLMSWFTDDVVNSVFGLFGTCIFGGGIIATMVAVSDVTRTDSDNNGICILLCILELFLLLLLQSFVWPILEQTKQRCR